MPFDYTLSEAAGVPSPALLFYREAIERNIARSVTIAGHPDRLRPHVKTHKTREISRLWLAAGVTKHKCATIAEAEMLAGCGAADVLIAYPIVGPNCARVAMLAGKFPSTRFGVTIDHPGPLDELTAAMSPARAEIDAYLDINCGMNRTGIIPGDAAFELYRAISAAPGLRAAGFHVYDGHNNQASREERETAVAAALAPVRHLRQRLESAGLPVPRLVLGGTPTFGIHAKNTEPGVECSPGTLSLHDFNYGTKYPELKIIPAAVLLTRVISNPAPGLVTLDLGYKAVSPDQPAGKRCTLLGVDEYEPGLQNEEHFVIRTSSDLPPGTVIYAIPAHVCPTVALHRFAHVVDKGKIVDRWEIVARDRELTV